MRQRTDKQEEFNGVDVRKLLEEHRVFANSKDNVDVRLVDAIASAFFSDAEWHVEPGRMDG
jgi:hypothetical protein